MSRLSPCNPRSHISLVELKSQEICDRIDSLPHKISLVPLLTRTNTFIKFHSAKQQIINT